MNRDVLSDAQWEHIEPLLLGKPEDPGRQAKNNRLFIEAVPWLLRTAAIRPRQSEAPQAAVD